MRRISIGLLVLAVGACAGGAEPPERDSGLSGDSGSGTDGGVRFGDGGAGDAGSVDAALGDGGFRWPVATTSVAITPSDAWKNRISVDDPFVRPSEPDAFGAPQSPRWVKFTVLMQDPSRVYFQDSQRYPFHHEMITAHLDPWVGETQAEVERLSLFERDQALILGAVLFPPRDGVAELGIQLERQDAYHPEMARIVLALVRGSVDTSSATRALYFPAYAQEGAVRSQATFFEASGFPVASAERWRADDACYAPGWALGRLVELGASEVAEAYLDGRLTRDDVLLTGVPPAELPLVAGVLMETPSHAHGDVTARARTYGIPLVHVRDPDARSAIRGRIGRTVAVRTSAGIGGCRVQVLDAEGQLTADQSRDLRGLAEPPPLTFARQRVHGGLTESIDTLALGDGATVGAAAAQLAVLRDALPAASTPGVALSFDLGAEFLAQPLGGRTLAAAIGARLDSVPSDRDVPALRAALAEVRGLIVEQGQFSASQRTAVLAALAGLAPDRWIGFTASTNAEERAGFSGAVLYATADGCLADDTDGDELGPSHCDPAQAEERGALRAIRQVYAGYYGDDVYLERRRRGVVEADVGMGVLARPRTAAEHLQATGVATLGVGMFSSRLTLVTQRGALPVSSETAGARPEIVDVDVFGDTLYPAFRERSSLVPLGGSVLAYREDYDALAALLIAVGERFVAASGRAEVALELTYEKSRPAGTLRVTGLREIASDGSDARMLPSFLLGETTRRCTSQGESGDVFANHRLKSRWTLSTRSTWLQPPALAGTTYGEVELEVVEDGGIARSSGLLGARPGHQHAVEAMDLVDGWQVPGINGREVSLRTSLAREVRAESGPVLTLGDAWLSFAARWATPVFDIDFTGAHTTRTEDYTVLGECPDDRTVDGRNRLVEREAVVAGRRVWTSFWWPRPPGGISAGYTAPLHKWKETVLEGFTAQPVVLRGYWSQTYRPGHHNFTEEFVFEPRLEAGLPPAVLAELENAGVRWIHVTVGEAEPRMAVMGTDGVYRPL